MVRMLPAPHRRRGLDSRRFRSAPPALKDRGGGLARPAQGSGPAPPPARPGQAALAVPRWRVKKAS